MATFVYPNTIELERIAQIKLPRLAAARPIFKHFPIVNKDSTNVRWEQMDNFIGLQQIRGLNGDPPRVKRVGAKSYTTLPGAYGEFVRIDEKELTERRQYGSFDRPVAIDDLVAEGQDQLMLRELDRIEQILWTLAVTGTYSVVGPTGTNAVMATDSYTPQTFTASVAWSTPGTSTPLADLRAIKLLGRGISTDFGAGAIGYANQTTINNMLTNTNSADVYGRRTGGLGTFNSLPQMNQLFAGDDLLTLVPYDEGYYDDAGSFQLYIPNSKVAVFGKRSLGEPIGEYQMVRNVNNPGERPGPYNKVIDRGEMTVPRSIEVHRGHNGGPAIKFPASVVIMTV